MENYGNFAFDNEGNAIKKFKRATDDAVIWSRRLKIQACFSSAELGNVKFSFAYETFSMTEDLYQGFARYGIKNDRSLRHKFK